MKIVTLTYEIEQPDEQVDTRPMTEAECREIISPIIRDLTHLLRPEVMIKLTLSVRDEAKGDNQFIADFWKAAKDKFLPKEV